MQIFIHRGKSKARDCECGGNVRDADIAGIVSELKRLESDNSGFDALIARIRSDSSIKQAEMNQIGSGYLGRDIPKSTSKGDILQRIINRQMVAARTEARASNIR